MPSLAGKVAVVTGGSRGIGLAVARLLRDRGASVAITGTSPAGLEKAVDALGAGSDRVLSLCADVRDAAQMDAAMAQAASAFGGNDIVVNNAGVGVFKPVAEMSPDEFRLMFETNVTGVFNSSRAALPYLRARGGGWVINVSSLSGTNPHSRNQQLGIVARKSAGNGRCTPHQHTTNHDPDAIESIDHPAHRDTHQHIGRSKGKTLQKADLRIRDPEIGANRLNQQIQYLSINK